jgi:hypothetical protein
MVNPRHRHLLACAAALLASLLCQCETQRTVKSTRSSISFDPSTWGGQAQGQGDTKEIRSKFAERGYSITEDGTIKADKPDLYRGQTAKTKKGYQTKEARFSKTESQTKQFRTPEYLQRQEFRGVAEAREANATAREGDSRQSPDREAGKLFGTKARSSGELASYGTGSYRESGTAYATGPDSAAAAVENAPRATGTPRKAGYQDNVALSMDDVKKMLNPGSYARGTGIAD